MISGHLTNDDVAGGFPEWNLNLLQAWVITHEGSIAFW
jgi:hypothetical protein